MMILDTMMDYLRLVAYATIILTSLRGIAKKKFTNILFVGDIIISITMIIIVIYIHLFEITPVSTLWDDVILTTGAVIWAIIHFISVIKFDKEVK